MDTSPGIRPGKKRKEYKEKDKEDGEAYEEKAKEEYLEKDGA